MTDLSSRLATETPLYIDPPPYATDRTRWHVCCRLAEAISRANEPTGEPDLGFCWNFAREAYLSEMPIGSVDDLTDDELTALRLTRDEVAAALQLP